MKRVEKTVFISYRRTNVPWALAIFHELTQHGYDVFFDFQGIGSGDFERVILENVKARAHFLVLLTPSALERCGDPGDWLRREIETALDTRRNIVPLMLEGFDFATPAIARQLTGKLAPRSSYNALRVPADFFFEAMGRLREKYLNVALDAVLHPASTVARQAAKTMQAAAGNALTVQEKELTEQGGDEPAPLGPSPPIGPVLRFGRTPPPPTAEAEFTPRPRGAPTFEPFAAEPPTPERTHREGELLGEKPREFPSERTFTNSIGMKFVLILPGTFMMGSPAKEEGRRDGERQHEVTISKPFYLQTTQVTQGQWKRIMKTNPWYFKECGDYCPVEGVSWNDAQAFISKLNEVEGGEKYRLPTEAEWEYACRAGSNTGFCFGEDEAKLGEYAWYKANSKGTTHPVGQNEPNDWGLYDMHGNVWEWVEDDWHDSYDAAPNDGSAWIDNPRGSFRVIRGGCWRDDAHACRSAMRLSRWPDSRYADVGFRLSRSVALGS